MFVYRPQQNVKIRVSSVSEKASFFAAALFLVAVALPAAAQQNFDLYTVHGNDVYHVSLDSGYAELVTTLSFPPLNPHFITGALIDPNGRLLFGGHEWFGDFSAWPGTWVVGPDWSLTRDQFCGGNTWEQFAYLGDQLFTQDQYGMVGPAGSVSLDAPIPFTDVWFMVSDGSLLYLFAWDGTLWHNYSMEIGDPVDGHYPGHLVELSQTAEDSVHFGPACFLGGALHRYAYDGQGSAWLYAVDLTTGQATVASPSFWCPAIAIWVLPRR